MKITLTFSMLASTLLLLTSNAVLAQEGDELFDLCSKFPQNSKCQDYTAPVSLEDRPGEAAQCMLGDEEETESCKVDLIEETLTLYVETGEDVEVLDGDKDSKEVTIPLSAIKSFYYSEEEEIDTDKVLTFGVIGLIDKDEISTFDFLLKPQSQTESSTIPNQLLLVTGRDTGEEMLSEIEAKTQLTAETWDEDEEE